MWSHGGCHCTYLLTSWSLEAFPVGCLHEERHPRIYCMWLLYCVTAARPWLTQFSQSSSKYAFFINSYDSVYSNRVSDFSDPFAEVFCSLVKAIKEAWRVICSQNMVDILLNEWSCHQLNYKKMLWYSWVWLRGSVWAVNTYPMIQVSIFSKNCAKLWYSLKLINSHVYLRLQINNCK